MISTNSCLRREVIFGGDLDRTEEHLNVCLKATSTTDIKINAEKALVQLKKAREKKLVFNDHVSSSFKDDTELLISETAMQTTVHKLYLSIRSENLSVYEALEAVKELERVLLIARDKFLQNVLI